MKWLSTRLRALRSCCRGGVLVEYLLLLTIIGIGIIAGLATVRTSLLNELGELAIAIANVDVGI